MKKTTSGFTIVELLIVIVVVAILAAITIVAYNGIQSRGYDASVQSDLRNFGSAMEQQNAINGSYPLSITTTTGVKLNHGAYDTSVNNLYYCVPSNGSQFSITARSRSGNNFTYRSSGGLKTYTGTYGGANSCTDAGMASGDWRDTGYGTVNGWSTTWPN